MIVGLAGHVDHGKSALVTALTGVATDRAPEAQARGITIDLQAVALRDTGGEPIAALIDVPGHEDFVRAMVAGSSGITAVLLVIAADEGMMPQTREHLLIIERLGVPRGIPVITKIDLVEPEWLELLVADLSEQLAMSSVAFEPAVLVSARSGSGIDALRARIAALSHVMPAPRDNDLFRLPVDKVFRRAGIGTIVTGTAWSGRVRIGDTLRSLPAGDDLRVRSLETHGRGVDIAGAGQRVAISIAGLAHSAVHRGEVLVHAHAAWQVTTAFDAEVVLAAAADRPLSHRRRVTVHLGTASVGARVMPRTPIAPGNAGFARVVLDSPMVARGGDRAVLRSWSPAITIGGATVLDPMPPARATWPAALSAIELPRRLEALVARRRNGLPHRDVPFVLGVPPAEGGGVIRSTNLVALADRLVDPAYQERWESAALRALAAHHAARPKEGGLSVETLRRSLGGAADIADAVVAGLIASGKVTLIGGVATLASFTPVAGVSDAVVGRVVERLRALGLAAPSAAELVGELGEPDAVAACREAERQGLLAAVEHGWWVPVEDLSGFERLLRELGAKGPITVAAARDRTGLSRKFLVPLLEWADRRGTTCRVGADRVVGPRPSA